MNKNYRKIENIVGFTIALLAFIVYSITACRSINFIDSGELATACYTLGICHPTGYPIFTLFGWVFSHLPLGLRTIHQLNLMSSVFAAAGLYFFFKLLHFTIQLFAQNRKSSDSRADGSFQSIPILSAAVGTIVLAFSVTFWSQTTSIEVYPLHIFFVSVLLFLFVRAVFWNQVFHLRQSSSNEQWRYLLIFAFVLGLSFTNHMTTILLAPAFLYLFFWRYGVKKNSWRRIGVMLLPFLLGFSAYFYLPVRASEHPYLNWGNPIDFEKWFWHFSGKVYRVWIFSSTESAAKQFNYFIKNLTAEFAYFPLLIAVAGFLFFLKRNKNILIFTILLFLTCLFYSINYDIHDIDSYFLLAYMTISIWVGLGSFWILDVTKFRHNLFKSLSLIIIVASLLIGINLNKVDQSKNKIVENYARDMFNSVDKNSIIISYQWDYFVSAAYYLQLVEEERQDIVIIDKELLRRSWYYVQLQNRYPWLLQQIKIQVNNFLTELNKFEHNLPYNSEVIEYYYQQVIRGIVENNVSIRSVYITPEIEDQYTQGFYKIPSGLTFKLSKTISHEMLKKTEYSFSKTVDENIYTDGIKNLYARSYLNYGLYYKSIGKTLESEEYFQKAFLIQPSLASRFQRQ
jgi:hypothetical protein